MADYTVRIEATTEEAEKKLKRVERHIDNIEKDVKVNIQLPTIQQTTSALATFGATAAEVGKTALDLSRKLNVGPGAVLNDLEDLFGKVSDKGQQAVSVFEAISKATPTRILGTSFDVATGSVERFSKQVANLGFVLFGITQSVNVLKQAFGGFFNETIGREIRLQESLLRTKTTLISTADVIQNGQRLTDPTKALAALDAPVEKTLQNIRRRSLEIAGTTSDAIIQVFGVVASQVGAIGGSLKDAEDLAITFAGALGTIGMSDPMLANQEIRSILTGNIDQNSVLARSLGITNEEIQKAKRSTEGLVAYLTKRLQGFTAGQKLAAQGFSGIVSNIQEVREEASRSFGKPLLEPLLNSLAAVYDRLQLIFDQILAISTNAGKAAANLTSGILNGITSAPVLQNFTPEREQNAASALAESTKNAAANVEREIDKVRPIIARITNEVLTAIGRISQGLFALLKGFTYFKFEELKVLATAFANMGEVLNATVVPALQTVLNLYGAFLEMPVVNYLAQVQAQHTILERLGVNSILRLIATWKFYQESINTAIGWVRTAASAIKSAFDGIVNFVAGSISGLGAAVERTLEFVLNAISQTIIKAIQLVASGAKFIGLQLVLLGRQLRTAFPGQPLGQVGAGLIAIGKAFRNIDYGLARTATNIRNFATVAQQELLKIGVAADKAAERVRGLGAYIGGALTTGIQKLGSALKGLIIGFIQFQAWLFVVQAGAAVLTDAFGRYQRAAEAASAGRRTDQALDRLSTVYSNLGDNVDEATKRAAAFERQLVETRYTQNQQEIEDLTQKIAKLKKEMETPGIQSWGELMRTIFVDPITAVDVLTDKFSGLRDTLNDLNRAFKFTFDRIKESIDAVTTNGGLQQWLLMINPLLTSMQGLVIKLALAFGFLLEKLDKLSQKLLNQNLLQALGTGVVKQTASFLSPVPLPGVLIDKLLEGGSGIVDGVNRRNITEDERYRQQLIQEQQRIEALTERENQEENTRLANRARMEGLKELKEYERELDKQLFEERQSLARKEVELFKSAETFRIEQISRANAKRLEGEEGASAAALQALNEYVETKAKGELEIQTMQKEMAIELASLDRKVADYRYEMEKRIAAIRMRAAQYDAQARAGATSPEAGATGQAFTGNSGRSTGPHADIRGENRESVINETMAAIRKWQAEGVQYIQLSNARIDVKGITDENQLRAAVIREVDAHGTRVARGTYAADIAVPVGTRVPSPLSGVQWDPNGGGYYGRNPSTGNRWLHLAENSKSGAAPGSTAGAGVNKAQAEAMSFFTSKGLSPMAAAALVGGLMQESTVNLNASAVNSQGNEGIAQWGGSRKSAMIAYGARNNRQKQLEFMWHELLGPENAAYQRLKGATTLNDSLLASSSYFRFKNHQQLGVGEEWGSRIDYTKGLMRSGIGAGAGAPPALALPGSVSGLPDAEAIDASIKNLGESIVGTQEKLKQLLINEANLKKLIAQANTKEKFQAIAKQLYPLVPLEQFKDKQLELQEALRLTAELGAAAYDPENFAITLELSTRKLIKEREHKEVLAEIAKRTDLTETEKKALIADLEKQQETFNNALEEEGKLRRENLSLTRAITAQERLRASIQERLNSTREQLLDADFAARAITLPEDDYRGRRMLDAEREIARERLRLEQSGINPAQVQRELDQFAQVTRATAEALANLDETAADLAERVALARDSAQIITDGYKGMISSVMAGGDIKEAVGEMGRNIAARFTEKFLDYAFKPMEQQMEKMFRDLFGVDEAEERHKKAVEANTEAIKNLTTAITGQGTAPGAPTPTPPSTTPESGGLTTLPWNGNPGLLQTLPDFGGAATYQNLNYTPTNNTLPSFNWEAPEIDFSKPTASFTDFNAVTKNFAVNTQANAKATEGGTEQTLSSMQKYTSGLASVATAALGIVGGIQMIKEGGTSNVLGGIGSIFMSLGGALSGFAGIGGLFGRASGGPVSARTPYLVGEMGPELFVPNSFGSIKPNNQLRQAMNSSLGNQTASAAMEFRFKSEVINNVEYISRDQLDQAMVATRRRASAEGARRGMSMTLDRLQQSPSTRAKVGLR